MGCVLAGEPIRIKESFISNAAPPASLSSATIGKFVAVGEQGVAMETDARLSSSTHPFHSTFPRELSAGKNLAPCSSQVRTHTLPWVGSFSHRLEQVRPESWFITPSAPWWFSPSPECGQLWSAASQRGDEAAVCLPLCLRCAFWRRASCRPRLDWTRVKGVSGSQLCLVLLLRLCPTLQQRRNDAASRPSTFQLT